MARGSPKAGRRAETRTKAQIVEAAIAILDAEGEASLTFRALAARLSTGAGAIYWHVANKDDLLAAATDQVVSHAMATIDANAAAAEDAIRAISLAVFDAFDAHPWIGDQLSLAPGRSGMLQVFEAIGSRLEPLGVPQGARFDAWSALVNYIFGVAAQNADNARRVTGEMTREALLETIAGNWSRLDATEYPFLHEIAACLPGLDDREQFLAGINLILGGIFSAL
ncbi:MAG: TetR/AcrR family transcriptional regulator [Novosphingobium sp.]|nr:TetR/AcrR family transcriptional regulator [Novosphingobium sp.]